MKTLIALLLLTTIYAHSHDLGPSTFTNDYCEYNEGFGPTFYTGVKLIDYNFKIYNRWGELLFESKKLEDKWDGTYGDYSLVQDGTYIWVLEFSTEKYGEQKHKGQVTVLK